MDTGIFRIKTRESMGNLHLRLEGVFNGESALALTALLHQRQSVCNRLFIDTDKLHRVETFGTEVFHSFLRRYDKVSERIYFKGKNGTRMALDGQRVIRVKPDHGCGCSGKCTVCKCAQRKKQHDAVVDGKENDNP